MNLLKSTLIRKWYAYLRYIFFVFILKKYNFLSSGKKNFIPNANEDFDEMFTKDNSFSENIPKNYLKNLSNYESKAIFKNPFDLKILHNFTGGKSSFLLNPILSLSFLDKKNSKVLSIGPRTEGEIFNIISNGFKKKNVKAIDIQSYSPLIDLGDIHEIKFQDNSFDLIICGWVIAYSYNRVKAIKEIIRVSKNGAFVSIGSSCVGNEDPRHVSNDYIKKYLGTNLKKVYYQLDPSDYPDNYKKAKYSIISFSVKK